MADLLTPDAAEALAKVILKKSEARQGLVKPLSRWPGALAWIFAMLFFFSILPEPWLIFGKYTAAAGFLGFAVLQERRLDALAQKISGLLALVPEA